MHILIIAMGSAGNVHTLIGLARTFVKRGHRVSFCTNPAFAPAVARANLRLLPLGTAEEYNAAIHDPALLNPRTSFKVLWKVLAVYIRPLFDLLETEVDSETVLVGSLWAFGARLMQEKYGTPFVSLQVSPAMLSSSNVPAVQQRCASPALLRAGLQWALQRVLLDHIYAPLLNRERALLGLAPVQHILGTWVHSTQEVLGLFPAWFAPPQTDWPERVTLTGFPLCDEGDFYQLDDQLEDFLQSGPPPVIVTMGSTLSGNLQSFAMAAQVLQRVGQRGILLAKQGDTVPPLPSTILVRTHVPLSKLLPRARMLVHHGGIGTLSQALAAGIPQLAIPCAHDQFENAARMTRLGCGLRLESPMTEATLFEAVTRLLEDEAIQTMCATTRHFVTSGEASCLKALSIVEATGRSLIRVPRFKPEPRSGARLGPRLVHA